MRRGEAKWRERLGPEPVDPGPVKKRRVPRPKPPPMRPEDWAGEFAIVTFHPRKGVLHLDDETPMLFHDLEQWNEYRGSESAEVPIRVHITPYREPTT